jgi:hypothetical protein
MVTNWPPPVVMSLNSCENVGAACAFKVLIIFARAGNAAVGRR